MGSAFSVGVGNASIRWPIGLVVRAMGIFGVVFAATVPVTGPCLARAEEVYWYAGFDLSDTTYQSQWYLPSGRYHPLVEHLAPLGYQFTEANASLESVDLANYKILVLATQSLGSAPFSVPEVNAVESFLEQGGGLLVLSDAMGTSGEAKLEQITTLFDARGQVSQFPGYDVYSTSVSSHPATAGVDTIYERYAASIDPGNLTAYAWHNTMPMLAAGRVEAGRVVMISDNDLFTYAPGAGGGYFDQADNRQLAVSTFNYLLPEPATLSLLALGGVALIRRRRN